MTTRWLFLMLLLSSCNATSTAPSTSPELCGLDNRTIAHECDWIVTTLAPPGRLDQSPGYGAQFACDGGITVRTFRTRAECVDTLPLPCGMTVGDLEKCINAVASNPCSLAPRAECAKLAATSEAGWQHRLEAGADSRDAAPQIGRITCEAGTD